MNKEYAKGLPDILKVIKFKLYTIIASYKNKPPKKKCGIRRETRYPLSKSRGLF